MELSQYITLTLRSLLTICATLIFGLFSLPTDAHGFQIQDYTVKITTSFPDDGQKIAMGLIYSQRNDSLVVVSITSVLESGPEDFTRIAIEFPGGNRIEYSGTYYTSRELLILKFKKPSWFRWNQDVLGAEALVDNIVYLYGRYGDWNDFSDRIFGRVINIDGSGRIDIETNSIESGYPGTPVVLAGNVVGLVIRDTGNRVIATPIQVIQDQLNYFLDIDVNNYRLGRFYVLLGTKGNSFLPLSKKYDKLDYIIPGLPKNLSSSFYLEWSFFPDVSLRFEKEFRNSLTSQKLKLFDDEIQSRNITSSYSFYIQLKEQISLFDNPDLFTNFYLGYTRLLQTPQLKFNSGRWRNLDDFDEVQYQIPKQINTYKLGTNTSVIVKDFFVIGTDFGFWYTGPDYIVSDPLDPFEKNGIRFHAFLEFSIGFLLYDGQTFKNYIR